MKGRKGHGKVAIKSKQVELWKAFGRYGEGNVAICSKSNQDSIPEAENLPAEVISHRYRGSIPHRNKDSIPEAKNLPAEVISHRNKDSIPHRNKDSIPEAKNMPAEVISHRERRRRLFAKASVEDNKSLAASLVLHREDIWSFSNFLPSMMDSIHPFYRIGEAESVLLAGGILRTEAPDSEVLPRRMEVEKEKEGRTIMEAPRKMEEDSIIEVPMKTEVEEFVFLAGELWSTGPPKTKVLPRRMEVEKEGRAMIMEEHETPEPELMELYWMSVSQFRRYWDKRWSGHYGSFEDTTKIPPMRFTYKPAPEAVVHDDTLQIYSVKLAATSGTLQLPLDVFGVVAVRDQIDHNRNIIFHRERDDCQTLTEKDPHLVLSGPTRAVMMGVYNPVVIEVDLKVKGTTESKDVYLSFFVVPIKCYDTMFSHLFNRAYTSKLSTLEFSLGQIGFSVEATIFVHIVRGSWLDGLRGLFTATTTGLTDRRSIRIGEKYSTGTGAERIILLDSGGEKLTIANDGKINLSRSVVSVEDEEELIVQVKAFKGEIEIVGKKTSFRALKAGKSINQIDMGFCEMEVIVFWSLISCCP